jgi:transposase
VAGIRERTALRRRTGCPWRALPHDFTVTWTASHKDFLRWTRAGLWRRILRLLREEARQRAGRRKSPTAAVIDSSSVKGTPLCGPRGFDGAKKIDGIKRHIAVDTSGLLIAAHVTPAKVQDRAAFPALIRKTTRACSGVRKVWLDKGYTGQTVAERPSCAASTSKSCPARNPRTGSSSSPDAGSSNAPTAGSTAAGDSSANTRAPPKPTKAS